MPSDFKGKRTTEETNFAFYYKKDCTIFLFLWEKSILTFKSATYAKKSR